MEFVAERVSHELIASLCEPLERLRRVNPSLADQAKRAAQSVGLNVGEGGQRTGRDRIYRFRIAAGSAAELRNALRIAVAWRELGEAELAPAFALIERQLRLLWGLTHPKDGSTSRASRAPDR